MDMTIHWGLREHIIFQFWKTGTFLGFITSLIIIFLISFLFEAVRWTRFKLAEYEARSARELRSDVNAHESDSSAIPSESRHILSGGVIGRQFPFLPYRFNHAFLYGLQTFISFTIMLCLMTYNGWIILTIIFGVTVGYAFFNVSPLPENFLQGCC
uniref:Copper transport protein n=1 Tax=Rhabditophanes sp. KR3021 TaxID=114890 RepID=A0AC35U596_9BILA